MTRYIIKRLVQAVFTLWGLVTLVFILAHMTGDPATMIIPRDLPKEAEMEWRREFGLDKPLAGQYVDFMISAVQGRFGKSWHYHQWGMSLVLERVPASLQLALVSIIFVIIVAIPAGMLAAVRERTWVDYIVRGLSTLGQAIPFYWLGLLLIILFAVKLRILPTGGKGDFRSFIMPACVMGFWSIARVSRLTRSNVLENLRQDYVRTARAKGLAESLIYFRHVLKNAALPIITLIAIEFGIMFGNAIITETVFAWPGVGRLLASAVLHRDFPVIQAGVFFTGAVIVLLNLITDLMYAWLNPTIRYGD